MAGLEAGLLAAAGPHYVRAVIITTVFRSVRWVTFSPSRKRPLACVRDDGVLVLPAALGAIVSAARGNPPQFTPPRPDGGGGPHRAGRPGSHPPAVLTGQEHGFRAALHALAAGYAISAGIDWLGERYAVGKIAGSVAAVALIILTLVVGREQTVQFRGRAAPVAREIISAIKHGYRQGTYIASDGAPSMEKYYLPRIPDQAWLGIFDPSAQQRARFGTRICTGRISLVILRRFQDSYHHPYDYQIHRMMARSQRYRLEVAVSQGNYATQVWGLRPAAGRGACG